LKKKSKLGEPYRQMDGGQMDRKKDRWVDGQRQAEKRQMITKYKWPQRTDKTGGKKEVWTER
jgi:hypothetical protein